ncbi:MAG: hypothetical protein GEV07_22740 [Streptosporangiales bacterium]|nr:hypothetical protein [Streptosporangiales bacterium]
MAQQRSGPAAYALLLVVLCACCLFVSTPAESDQPAGKRSSLAAVIKDFGTAPVVTKRLGSDGLDAALGPVGGLGVALLLVLAAASPVVASFSRRRLRSLASRAPPHALAVHS